MLPARHDRTALCVLNNQVKYSHLTDLGYRGAVSNATTRNQGTYNLLFQSGIRSSILISMLKLFATVLAQKVLFSGAFYAVFTTLGLSQ